MQLGPLRVAVVGAHAGFSVRAGLRARRRSSAGLLVAAIETGVRDGSIRSDVTSHAADERHPVGLHARIIQLTTTKAHSLAHHGVAAKDLIDHAIAMITRDLKT
jgi:hypothetical protein